MDVRSFINSIITLSMLLLVACSPEPSAKSKIIDENNNRFGGSCVGQSVDNKYIIRWKDGRTTTAIAENQEALIANVIEPNNAEISFVEADRVVQLEDSKVQTTVVQTADTTNWGQQVVEASSAWSANITGEGVLVAVVDSGVDISHSQLKNQLVVNSKEKPNNGMDDDGNGYVDDYYGYDFYYKTGQINPVGEHATHVAGVILGQHGVGPIEGVAPSAKLLPLNFMSENGSGDLSDAILAIEYAVARGAKVINASWGGAPCSEALYQTLYKLQAAGVIIVVAAGNESTDIDYFPSYPAAYNVAAQITIGATASTDRMAGFSNYGSQLVHLMAPGMSIWSTVPNENFAMMSGTSMAAPFVSGAVALLKSYRPSATTDAIKRAILNSVDLGNYPVKTQGRLNIRKAISQL